MPSSSMASVNLKTIHYFQRRYPQLLLQVLKEDRPKSDIGIGCRYWTWYPYLSEQYPDLGDVSIGNSNCINRKDYSSADIEEIQASYDLLAQVIAYVRVNNPQLETLIAKN